MNLCRYANTRKSILLSVLASIALIAALVLTGQTVMAQSSAASIDGTVLDTSGALVPGAAIELRNQASGDQRTATSNGEGFFNFAAVPPGSYTVRVSMQGFSTWEARDILVASGDHRGLARS